MHEKRIQDSNRWANECAAHADSVSKQLFESFVADEERHLDQDDVEKDNVEKFGERSLVLQSIERSTRRAAGQPAERTVVRPRSRMTARPAYKLKV
jgi:bacterioferritin